MRGLIRMKESLDDFLQTIYELEEKVVHLIHQSNLSAVEKKFILDHILIIPGKSGDHEESKVI
jgi:hypothetical protein